MNHHLKLFLTVTSLVLASLACQALAGGSNSSPTEAVPENTSAPIDTSVPPVTQSETATPNPDALLENDFSASRTQWGTGTDADSSIEYLDEALNMQVFKKNYFVWSTPNDNDYENIHMEVTVINNDTDPTTAFGFICDQQFISDSFYYLVITPAGQYVIAKATVGLADEFLTNNNEWGNSDLIAKNAGSYRVGADCGNGTLTLYVEGQQVASVSDSTYTNGGIALMTWSGQDASTTNVSFDDFVMTKLP